MLAEWEGSLKPLAEPPGGWLKQIFNPAGKKAKQTKKQRA